MIIFKISLRFRVLSSTWFSCSWDNIWLISPCERNFCSTTVCPSKTTAPLIRCCLGGDPIHKPWEKLQPSEAPQWPARPRSTDFYPHKMSPPAKPWNSAKSFFPVRVCICVRARAHKDPTGQNEVNLLLLHSGLIIDESWWFIPVLCSSTLLAAVEIQFPPWCGCIRAWKSLHQTTFHFDVQMWGDGTVRCAIPPLDEAQAQKHTDTRADYIWSFFFILSLFLE